MSAAAVRAGGLTLRVGAVTDVGRVRPHNEDSLLAAGSVFVVADGMGGHAAGEVASGIVTDTLREVAAREPLGADDVVAAVVEAHGRIVASVAQHPEQTGMGTTVAGLAVVSDDGRSRWLVLNVGDSRVYRLADGRLDQVTVDHSEVAELVAAGLITVAEAARHPLRNIITRSLGADAVPQVDRWLLEPSPGERFLVCSDGLNGELDEARMAELLGAHEDPQDAAVALVAAAVEAGGRDNVTVVVVDHDA